MEGEREREVETRGREKGKGEREWGEERNGEKWERGLEEERRHVGGGLRGDGE